MVNKKKSIGCCLICVTLVILFIFAGCNNSKQKESTHTNQANTHAYSKLGFDNRYGFNTFIEVIDCDFEDDSVLCLFNVYVIDDDAVNYYENVSMGELKSDSYKGQIRVGMLFDIKSNDCVWLIAQNLHWIIIDRYLDKNSDCVALVTVAAPGNLYAGEKTVIMPLEMLDLTTISDFGEYEGESCFSCKIKNN